MGIITLPLARRKIGIYQYGKEIEIYCNISLTPDMITGTLESENVTVAADSVPRAYDWKIEYTELDHSVRSILLSRNYFHLKVFDNGYLFKDFPRCKMTGYEDSYFIVGKSF